MQIDTRYFLDDDRSLTRAPLGEADSAPPLQDFLGGSKTAADIDRNLSVPSPASIWRLPPNFLAP